jgi:hypothetical protein
VRHVTERYPLFSGPRLFVCTTHHQIEVAAFGTRLHETEYSAFSRLTSFLHKLLSTRPTPIDQFLLTVTALSRSSFISATHKPDNVPKSELKGFKLPSAFLRIGHAAPSTDDQSLTTLKKIGLYRQHCLELFQHDEARLFKCCQVTEITRDNILVQLDLKIQTKTTVHSFNLTHHQTRGFGCFTG